MRAIWFLLALVGSAVLGTSAGAGEAADAKADVSVPAATAADDVPETVAERDRLIGELYDRLRESRDAETSTRIATAIERLWVYSGSETADLLLTRAATATDGKQPEIARQLLDALIGLEPRYAEAWNRRAYLSYSEQKFEAALADLSHVLIIEPRHFKALEGLGQILKEIGQKRLALKAFRKVLEINPMASEAREAEAALAREVEGQKI